MGGVAKQRGSSKICNQEEKENKGEPVFYRWLVRRKKQPERTTGGGVEIGKKRRKEESAQKGGKTEKPQQSLKEKGNEGCDGGQTVDAVRDYTWSHGDQMECVTGYVQLQSLFLVGVGRNIKKKKKKT